MAEKKPARKNRKKKLNTKSFVLNCVDSLQTETDWSMADAADANFVDPAAPIPVKKDLRAPWWKIDNQGTTGACVGFATACGVLRWHYVKGGLLPKSERPSPRFIWMANKETDEITSYPTTFLESAGTQTKLALRVAQKYGCVLDKILPMNGNLTRLSRGAFYGMAAKLRITGYYNLGLDLDGWRRWLALNGPILTRLNVEKTWDQATATKGRLAKYHEASVRGGHAVCLVGYTKDHFIVRNSWGPAWGDKGFAYAADAYAAEAFTEAYGAVI